MQQTLTGGVRTAPGEYALSDFPEKTDMMSSSGRLGLSSSIITGLVQSSTFTLSNAAAISSRLIEDAFIEVIASGLSVAREWRKPEQVRWKTSGKRPMGETELASKMSRMGKMELVLIRMVATRPCLHLILSQMFPSSNCSSGVLIPQTLLLPYNVTRSHTYVTDRIAAFRPFILWRQAGDFSVNFLLQKRE